MPKVNLSITDSYYGTLTGKFSTSNIASFRLEFENAYYTKSLYGYTLNYSLTPYYVLTLQANPNIKEEMRNMNINTNKFTVKKSEE